MSKSKGIKKSYINFFVPVTQRSVQQLMAIIREKLRKGAETITILISSPGGQVSAGVTAHNFLKGIPAEVIACMLGHLLME
jgi:ATP-dependent protease ClpP protease subunit